MFSALFEQIETKKVERVSNSQQRKLHRLFSMAFESVLINS